MGRLGRRGRRQPPVAPSAGAAARALAGKTLRGSRQQGAPGVPRLSALSPHVGLTRAHPAVDDTTNAITPGETVLHPLVLPGRGGTLDALLPSWQVAQTMVATGGEAVRLVKEHQQPLRADLALGFMLPPAGDRQPRFSRTETHSQWRKCPRRDYWYSKAPL